MAKKSVSKETKGMDISSKSFIKAIFVILILMVVSYALTFFIPGGQYARVDGAIDTSTQFNYVDAGIPFWKFILSPFLVLGAEGNTTLIAVILFLLVIGGVFNSLDRCGLMKYMLNKISAKFGRSRYKLLAVVMLFFMSLGSLIGSFEECVPLVPIVVALSINLGWDIITGLGMSVLAIGCGFAAGLFNPFTVGVAQQLSGLPMFSGAWLRALAFVLIYFLLLAFVTYHAKKVERPLDEEKLKNELVRDKKMDKGTLSFAGIMGAGVFIILMSSFITVLQDYTMIIVAIMFLLAGIVSTLVSGMGGKMLGKTFWGGLTAMAPAVIMILMASSIKFTLEEAHVLDTILHGAVGIAQTLPRWAVILFIYLIVLIMNFFIASGSAKAFMLIPLITPIAAIFNIPVQLCIVAYAFGDGFSNVFYPTNPVLLISLGLADLDYGKWFKWSWKFQAANLVLTSAVLLFGLAVGYGV